MNPTTPAPSAGAAAPMAAPSASDTASTTAATEFFRREVVYPKPLETDELTAVARRRQVAAGLPRPPAVAQDSLVGVALSGGGIRSATFCLGLFQALAKERLLRKIDFLSTVSGGGYFGSFLGGLFVRAQAPAAGTVEAALTETAPYFARLAPASDRGAAKLRPLRWLREHGRYLSPNGAGDTWLALAVALRNWVAVHVVLATFVLMLFLLLGALRAALWMHWPGGGLLSYEWMVEHVPLWVWRSPYAALSALSFLALMLPPGVVYWLTQLDWVVKLMKPFFGRKAASPPEAADGGQADSHPPDPGATGLEAGAVGELEFARSRARSALSRALAAGLIATLAVSGFALVDFLGQAVYVWWAKDSFSFPEVWSGLAAVALAVFGTTQKIFTLLEKMPGRRARKIPFELVALVVAALLGLGLLVTLSFVSHGFIWGWGPPPEFGALAALPKPKDGGSWLAWGLIVTIVLSFVFGRRFEFVNLSSHQQLYAARLKRAYLGASNPNRRGRRGLSIANPVAGDDIAFEQYRPHEHAGPLHLINVTVNETVSGKSQVEQRDRKGLAMAVGPCGLTVGARDHALWDKQRGHIRPLVASGATGFHALHADQRATAKKLAQVFASDEPAPQAVENLAVGNWVSISGAAFTTGLGSATTAGLSLLLGLANVRLGYWWDSRIAPHERRARTPPGFGATLGAVFAWLFPAQSSLLDEFLARFHGPARRHWYLSDGGHFENTGAYELIRRRVPFLVVSDAGRDTRYEFNDLANLVRKARTDFGAEIEFIQRRATAGQAGASAGKGPWLENLVHPHLLHVIGTPEDFAPVPAAAESTAEAKTRCTRHALLARVTYREPAQTSWLLILKPSLTGDEPLDVLHYQRAQPDFPQESTMDQYFDEAQWESYRKLGEHIGSLVFAEPPAVTDKPDWSPRRMCPPAA
jgi:hypothetical protein